LKLIGSIVIVLTLNANLTLFILALVPVLLLVAFVFGSRIQKVSTDVQDQLADSTTVAEEGLQGVRVVKSFGREAPAHRDRPRDLERPAHPATGRSHQLARQ
jgi:ATP-binding cassette, subfamily B, bacterial MsbA